MHITIRHYHQFKGMLVSNTLQTMHSEITVKMAGRRSQKDLFIKLQVNTTTKINKTPAQASGRLL